MKLANMQTTIHEAKTNLSRLIERAERGEEVDRPWRQTRGAAGSCQKAPIKRLPGMFRGEFEVGDSFFDPLPDDELAARE